MCIRDRFQLLRPFVPFSPDDVRKELQAYMIASSDPETYGQLRAYVVTNPTPPDGPLTVAATIESEPTISREISLLDQGNSSVLYGDLQLIPIGDGLLYLRPLYVQSDAASQPAYRYMLASYDQNAAFGETIQEVLGKLFPGFKADIGDVVGTDGSTATPTEPDQPDQPDQPSTTPEQLLTEADQLFDEANAALTADPPDFATYSEKINEARAKVQRALELLDTTGG